MIPLWIGCLTIQMNQKNQINPQKQGALFLMMTLVPLLNAESALRKAFVKKRSVA